MKVFKKVHFETFERTFLFMEEFIPMDHIEYNKKTFLFVDVWTQTENKG